MGELFFESHRLGALRDDIRESEPVFRNSDLLVLSMNAIRQTEAPGVTFPSANGFTAEESCQLARFAGLERQTQPVCPGRVSARARPGRTNISISSSDNLAFCRESTNVNRIIPLAISSCIRSILINLPKTGFNLTFYKSPASGRWWVEVPYPGHQISTIPACSLLSKGLPGCQ